MKKITNYDEDQYEQGDEPTRADIASEVGELMDKMLMTTDDLQKVVDTDPHGIEVEWYVKSELEYELEQQRKNNSIDEVLKKYGVTDIVNFKKELRKIGYKIEQQF